MSKLDKPELSAVGVAYGLRLRELEEARRAFLEERRRILTALARSLELGLREGKFDFSDQYVKQPNAKSPTPRFDVSSWAWFLDGEYATAWNGARSKSKRQEQCCGIDLTMEADEESPFGFRACVFFNHDKNEWIEADDIEEDGSLSAQHPLMKDLLRQGLARGVADVVVLDAQIYLQLDAVLLDSTPGSTAFAFDSLDAIVRSLPKRFELADQLAAKHYRAWQAKAR